MLNKEQRRRAHEARKAEHDKLTTRQKIAKVLDRVGKDSLGSAKGAKRELARLYKQLDKEQGK